MLAAAYVRAHRSGRTPKATAYRVLACHEKTNTYQLNNKPNHPHKDIPQAQCKVIAITALSSTDDTYVGEHSAPIKQDPGVESFDSTRDRAAKPHRPVAAHIPLMPFVDCRCRIADQIKRTQRWIGLVAQHGHDNGR